MLSTSITPVCVHAARNPAWTPASRAGVRSGGSLTAGGSTRLDRQDRFAARRVAQRVHERRPALYILQVEGDDPADVVRGQEGDHIGLVDVSLVADAEEAAEPDAAADGPVDDAAAQRRPDCERNAMLPLGGMPLTKVVLSGVCASITPMPFGPMIRMLWRCAIASISASRSAPRDPPRGSRPR